MCIYIYIYMWGEHLSIMQCFFWVGLLFLVFFVFFVLILTFSCGGALQEYRKNNLVSGQHVLRLLGATN